MLLPKYFTGKLFGGRVNSVHEEHTLKKGQNIMQFGIFSVGDITTNPVTGKTVSEYERQKNIVEIAKKAEEVGLDVVAVGQHHNPLCE